MSSNQLGGNSAVATPTTVPIVSPAPDVDITLIEDLTVSRDPSRKRRDFRLQFETTVTLPSTADIGRLRTLLQNLLDDPSPANRQAIFTFVEGAAGSDIPTNSRARAVIEAALDL